MQKQAEYCAKRKKKEKYEWKDNYTCSQDIAYIFQLEKEKSIF